MSMMDQLRSFKVLESFSLQQLASIVEKGELRRLQPGDLLFREGEESTELFFLLEGKLELRVRGSHLSDVPPLSLLGEMGVLRNASRVATAAATLPAALLVMKKQDFQKLIEVDTDLGMKFYRNLCNVLIEQLKKNNLVVEFFQAISR